MLIVALKWPEHTHTSMYIYVDVYVCMSAGYTSNMSDFQLYTCITIYIPICEYWVAFAFHFQLCFFVGFFLFCAFCFVTSCELQIRNRVESVAVSLLHIAYVWVRCVPCYDVLIEALEWLYWNCNIWQKSNSWFKYIAKHSQWRLTIHIFIDI